MSRCRSFNVSLILLLASACGKDLPELRGFDKAQWTGDKNACGGKRAVMLNPITEQKESLLALSEMDVVELLGRPDHNELYKRNQKFYIYFITPSQDCGEVKNSVSAKLVIRFNAMGLAKEVSIE